MKGFVLLEDHVSQDTDDLASGEKLQATLAASDGRIRRAGDPPARNSLTFSASLAATPARPDAPTIRFNPNPCRLHEISARIFRIQPSSNLLCQFPGIRN
jgi:hypothetical protein